MIEVDSQNVLFHYPGSSPPPPVLNFDDLDESLGVLSTNLAPLLEEADNVPAQDLETTSPSKDEQCSTAVPTEDVESMFSLTFYSNL